MPAISIIIPVYNAAKTLNRCLNSLIHQSFTDYEVILINDCSKDKSGDICDLIASKDERFKVIHLHTNSGASNARNVGLDEVKGKYITFIDSDDYVDKTFLKQLYTLINKYPYSFITIGFYKETDKTIEIIGHNNYSIRELNYYHLFKLNLSGYLWNKIYDASIIKKYNIKFCNVTACEDVIFNTDYIRYCNQILLCDIPLYHYIINPKSITNSYQQDALALNLMAFAARYPLIEKEYIIDFCDTYFHFFHQLFDNIFDNRCSLSLIQKFKYNQQIMSSPDFKQCVAHLSIERHHKLTLKVIKTYNYYLYWLYNKLYTVKSKLFN